MIVLLHEFCSELPVSLSKRFFSDRSTLPTLGNFLLRPPTLTAPASPTTHTSSHTRLLRIGAILCSWHIYAMVFKANIICTCSCFHPSRTSPIGLPSEISKIDERLQVLHPVAFRHCGGRKETEWFPRLGLSILPDIDASNVKTQSFGADRERCIPRWFLSVSN